VNPGGGDFPVRDEYIARDDSRAKRVIEQYETVQAEASARRRGRRVRLPLLLFLFTCLSTFSVGALGRFSIYPHGDLRSFFDYVVEALRGGWQNGLTYMFAVMGILLAHEMGHFLMTLRHHIPASLPFFIPLPLPPIGTMGAVIAMQGSQADRKQLFDIGLAGPLAGLVVAVPVLCAGIYIAEPVDRSTIRNIVTRFDGDTQVHPYNMVMSQPLLPRLIAPLLRPDLAGQPVLMNPLLLAGWVGLLITGLNMMPVSQLDGGHVAYALLGRKSHHLANFFLLAAVIFIVAAAQFAWILMLVLITLIGIYHPPTANDQARLGKLRTTLGWVSLIIPVLCFPPQPLEVAGLVALLP
jgi:membrane-associated protease RseP (regulator of RpoE activity)